MTDKNPHAVALGRLGGARSAATRLQAIPLPERKRIAKIAANASWGAEARAKRLKNGRRSAKGRVAAQHK